MKRLKMLAAVFAAVLGIVGAANARIEITEWMYVGYGSEFVEFTNVGSTPIDMTGWSFDDDSRTPGSWSLSGFGIVAPGQSVLLIEGSAATFRSQWNLAASVKIVDGNTHNLGRNDEINIYDAANNLVDRLTYGDEKYSGTVRTQYK
ncbi:MAG: lamin tail domain-containing protein, partial [Armatimonadetes bacterium]|nr:lamin tail domain-containing protein [Armatimonadota bacterium]